MSILSVVNLTLLLGAQVVRVYNLSKFALICIYQINGKIKVYVWLMH